MIAKKMRLSMAVTAMAASVLMTTPAAAAEKKEDTSTAKSESAYAKKAVADINSNTTLNIRKKGSLSSKIIGKMKKGNIAVVLEKGEQWSKIKSGSVTGYVKNDYLVFGEDVEQFAEKNIKKVAKVQTETLRVRKKASTDSEIITLVSEDDKLKVKNQNDEWAKVKVDGKTGYVSKDYATVSYKFGKAKSMKQIRAEEERKRKEQEAKEAREAAASEAARVSQTESSSVSSSGGGSSESSASQTSSETAQSVSSSSAKGSATGSRIASYAQQFVGNPYRYGGNSLTSGIDCSGFTQQVYANFGYSISRTSSSQAGNGTSVSIGNLQPGDLVFYGSGGGINHVALYIGGGQVVHASNSAPYPKGGIKISSVNYRTPVCARRIL